jgi:outer membrane immunogenic protein
MKKLFIAGIAAAAFCSASALAADLPTKGPAYNAAMAPIFDWTGFYVGGTAGGIRVHDQITGIIVFNKDSMSGFLGGPTVGYNFQSGPLVLGIEGDYSWTNVKHEVDFGCAPACKEKIPYFATARARIGYAANNLLAYVTGGAAFSRIERSQISDEGKKNVTGWTIGGGLEGAINNNWSWKVEYLFADFGRPNVFDPVIAGNERHDLTEQLVRVGINYKFGGDPWGKAPVSAKY